MSVQYRRMRPEDEDAVVGFWARVFREDGREPDLEAVRRELRCDAGRYDHTVVAAASNGTLVSTAHYWRNRIRSADGTPVPFGCVSHVATREDARREGHARHLMKRLLEGMIRDGCVGSILFASPMGRPLYEQLGWRMVPSRFRQGLLSGRLPETPRPYEVGSYDFAGEGWGPLARIHEEYNAARPFTTVRSEEDWRGYAGLRFVDGARIFATRLPGDESVRGYLRANYYPDAFAMTEIGILSGDGDAIPAMIDAAIREAIDRGLSRWRAYLPVESPIDESLEAICEVETGYHSAVMVRSLSAGIDTGQIASIYDAPGAVLWPVDDF